jgi:uncharacterized protein (DUF3084 family)
LKGTDYGSGSLYQALGEANALNQLPDNFQTNASGGQTAGPQMHRVRMTRRPPCRKDPGQRLDQCPLLRHVATTAKIRPKQSEADRP